MNKYILFLMLAMNSIIFYSCKKDSKILIPYPEDITFEDQQLTDFTFKIPTAPFKSGDNKSGILTFNVKNNPDGSFSGFAVSNKNWRSFPWSLSPDFPPAGGLTPAKTKSCIDSCIFSVYSTKPNQTNNFLVAAVKDEDASFSIDKPTVVEHILVANTTYNFLLETYGSVYSGTLNATTQQYDINGAKVKNINIANPSTALYGRFTLPGPGGQNLTKLTTGYVKLTVKGYNGSSATGSVDYYLAIRPTADPANPTASYILPNWDKVDLTALGPITRVVFSLSSSYQDGTGKMLVPPYFCLDGIRLKK
ncbi:DUF4465 domain-containing protein [Pedobacter sp. MC2016-24]|uniref:DUF4465 domain-containing protein n=1 Tax=Pedobacter sp. MC2016-24 TaxID=2780090 RepID=UPI0018815D72|nr:DUF4465 domain-containing protein [Pedobacter sp. MC2016-24]MBE9599304.1 DUF4465 domain-containing protein [Pedobacter sp. MC2016-24]